MVNFKLLRNKLRCVKSLAAISLLYIYLYSATILVIVLVFAGLPSKGQPMNPLTALSAGGAAISSLQKGWSGVSDFISGVRSFFGRAGDFTSRYGFDYSHIYNASLEYNILQTYQLHEMNTVMVQILHNINRTYLIYLIMYTKTHNVCQKYGVKS